MVQGCLDMKVVGKKNDMTQVLDCIWKYLAFIPVWCRIGFEALSGFASNQMLKVLRSLLLLLLPMRTLRSSIDFVIKHLNNFLLL